MISGGIFRNDIGALVESINGFAYFFLYLVCVCACALLLKANFFLYIIAGCFQFVLLWSHTRSQLVCMITSQCESVWIEL